MIIINELNKSILNDVQEPYFIKKNKIKRNDFNLFLLYIELIVKIVMFVSTSWNIFVKISTSLIKGF